jgi:hypothetical protein
MKQKHEGLALIFIQRLPVTLFIAAREPRRLIFWAIAVPVTCVALFLWLM